MENFHPAAKAGLDLMALFIIVGSYVEWLPNIAAGLSVAWYLYEFSRVFRGKK